MIKNNIETNKRIKNIEIVLIVLLSFVCLFCFVKGFVKANVNIDKIDYVGRITLTKAIDEECDEDLKICSINYINGEKSFSKEYRPKDFDNIVNTIDAHEYLINNKSIIFKHLNPTKDEIVKAYLLNTSDEYKPYFNTGLSIFVFIISLLVVLLFSRAFTNYEKIWFISVMFLSTLIAIIFPEKTINGVSGIIIMLLYLLDTFFNVLCELLISKQSRYNFIVSIFVEIVEILTCLILMYRFATLTTTLLFWLPIDIISFISWSKHKDKEDDELTVVRKLKGYQEVLVIIGIIVLTFVIGYFISGLNIKTDFLNNRRVETIIIYLDACTSIVGIANGLFILFRLKEQWYAWYLYSIIEMIINILSGQYVLLVLKVAFLVNTTYGYIKWSQYIKAHDNLI